jgi:hypothetical protein
VYLPVKRWALSDLDNDGDPDFLTLISTVQRSQLLTLEKLLFRIIKHKRGKIDASPLEEQKLVDNKRRNEKGKELFWTSVRIGFLTNNILVLFAANWN